MGKFCVFCGEKPEHKTNEHVIPKWLIELTGNPKRIARFGYNQEAGEAPRKRTFSFNAFQFPSCANCNQKYSNLEIVVKSVMQKIISDAFLSSKDFNALLDWFDKVRVGLWLGYQYLEKNPAEITPKFHIEKRIGQNDRMLVIYKIDSDIKQLNYLGCDTLSFRYTPSCFGLHINNYCFINISHNDLFSRRIGFPYPVESFMQLEDQLLSRFTTGRDRVMRPLFKKRFRIQGKELYQPMFRDRVFGSNLREFYDTEYVRENSMVWEQGIGKVFIESNSKLQEYPDSPSKLWLSNKTYQSAALLFEIQILILEWQIYIDDLAGSVQMLPEEEKQRIMAIKSMKKKFNTELITMLRKKAQEVGIPPLN